MAHDTADPAAARQGLPVILAGAVLQGWALYGLHRALDGGHWPATNAALLLALYAVAVYVPLTLQMLARDVASPVVRVALTVIAVTFFGFGLHQGGFVHGNLPGPPVTRDLEPLLFILALLWLQALPFVQGRVASGSWRFGYPLLFASACRNLLVLGEAAAFTGLSWLLLVLWGELFGLLGITFFRELFRELIFIYPVTALTFGIALHLIGSLERLTATVLDQVLSVLKWLGVPGHFILAIFSLALVVKLPGLLATGDWAIGAQLLLWLVAVIVLLLNAAYRDGADPAPFPPWLGRAIRVAVPLAVLVSLTALYALVLRTRQYGLTVERYWAFVVAGVALLQSVGYSGAAFRGGAWMRGMARVNVVGSLALMTVLALSLTPVLSPARLAAGSQFHRALAARAPDAGPPPWGDPPIRWLRFQGGGYGQARLRELAALEGHPDATRLRAEAAAALAAEDLPDLRVSAALAALDSLPIHPAGRVLVPDLRAAIEAGQSGKEGRRRFGSGEPGAGDFGVAVGVYLDLNGDGTEEFLLLSPEAGRVYARVGGAWAGVADVELSAGPDEWPRMLDDLAAGRVVAADTPWKDLVVGKRRIRVTADGTNHD